MIIGLSSESWKADSFFGATRHSIRFPEPRLAFCSWWTCSRESCKLHHRSSCLLKTNIEHILVPSTWFGFSGKLFSCRAKCADDSAIKSVSNYLNPPAVETGLYASNPLDREFSTKAFNSSDVDLYSNSSVQCGVWGDSPSIPEPQVSRRVRIV